MHAASSPLPPYAVRVSARSRRVRLVITPEAGLTVVTPEGFDPGRVPGIVLERLDWVNHHLRRAGDAQREAALPPASVELLAVGRVLAVRYRAAPGGCAPGTGDTSGTDPRPRARVRVRAPGPASLEVSGDIACRQSVSRALRAWLGREAARLLPPMLAGEARRCGLDFSGVTIRQQRTRWGSCSAKSGISLNARLLFLPPELAGYVLTHELAHTMHLNHSEKYWRFLEALSPDARVLDRALRSAGQYVPAWARG